jgi:hypothetical protein
MKLCPKCKSTDVHVDFSNHAVWGYGLPPKYECNSCGYINTFFIEVDKKDIHKVQETSKEVL